MTREEFTHEVKRVLQIKKAVDTMTESTPLDGLDSLGVVEVIGLAEECGKDLKYEDVRKMKTYGELLTAMGPA